MALELEGTIKVKLASQGGRSSRGEWVKQDFVLEFQDGNYPSDVCLTAFGQDKVDELAKFQVGDSVKVSFNVRAREYSGKWYNDLRVWRITPSSAQASAPASAPAARQYAPSASYQAPVAPAPSIDDMPAGSNDDLPF